MRRGLDDLIRFLLEEIALCGEQGRWEALWFGSCVDTVEVLGRLCDCSQR